mgnify:CR=1 FL=1
MLANEFARRSKLGGMICFLGIPAVLTIYFIAIYVCAGMGMDWALNNQTYTHMNSWFHYAKLYAATAGCIGFMMLKYKWSIGGTEWPECTQRSYPATACPACPWRRRSPTSRSCTGY